MITASLSVTVIALLHFLVVRCYYACFRAAIAVLLREGQQLVADLDLPALVFVLDGRSYVLEPAEPVYERTDKSKQAA